MGSVFNCMFHASLDILWLLLRLEVLPKISSELKRIMLVFPLISVVETERPMLAGLSVDAYKWGEQPTYKWVILIGYLQKKLLMTIHNIYKKKLCLSLSHVTIKGYLIV